MSFVRSFLSHPLTQALLASGDCVWFSAQGDMTPSFHSPEVKCLRWHRQREQSHNLLSNKNVKLTVWHSNLRGCLIYILSHKAVRRFPDVWHCNKVLIFCLTRPQHQNNSSYTGKRIGLLSMALNMNLFLLWQGKKKQHIWHKYKLFYPPGERCAQVSWRQFKCNGASKLIFPKII